MIGRVLRTRVFPRLVGRRRWAMEGNMGVRMVGHRAYIGGRWEEWGRVEFEFMVSRGLRPSTCCSISPVARYARACISFPIWTPATISA